MVSSLCPRAGRPSGKFSGECPAPVCAGQTHGGEAAKVDRGDSQAVGYSISHFGPVAERRSDVKRQFDALRFRISAARTVLMKYWWKDTLKAVSNVRIMHVREVMEAAELIEAQRSAEQG